MDVIDYIGDDNEVFEPESSSEDSESDSESEDSEEEVTIKMFTTSKVKLCRVKLFSMETVFV